MSRKNALQTAQQLNLDLLCVAPNAKVPVCKILDYGKYRFQQQKKQKEAKKNQTIIEVKEVQLSPVIGEHDLQTKLKHALRFLEAGNKVKVTMRFKGRQLSHMEVGQEIMDRFIELCKDKANVEKPAVLDKRTLIVILASKVKKQEDKIMPKMKSKKALTKRVKVTGSGQLKRHSAFISHLSHNKSQKQKRHLRKASLVHKSDFKRVKDLIQQQ